MKLSVLTWSQERLSEMFKHPEVWGNPEAFELQVLLLFELRYMEVWGGTRKELLLDWCAFAGSGNQPMSATCDDVVRISRKLEDFQHLKLDL